MYYRVVISGAVLVNSVSVGCLMYIDETVIAGLVVVLGTLGFFGGVGYFIYLDMKKHKGTK